LLSLGRFAFESFCGREADKTFFLSAFGIEFQESSQYLIADFGQASDTDKGSPAFARMVAFLLFLIFVIENELTARRDIGPSVCIKDGPIYRSVEFPELKKLGNASSGSWNRLYVFVNPSLFRPLNQRGICSIQNSCFLESANYRSRQEWERLEAIARRIRRSSLIELAKIAPKRHERDFEASKHVRAVRRKYNQGFRRKLCLFWQER